MDYIHAEQYLYDLRVRGTKLGLENTRRLLATINNPQNELVFIHIAGTNGKGSVTALLNAIFTAAGLKTGVFTSPHLVSLRERLKINNRVISPSQFARYTSRIKNSIEEVTRNGYTPTFFEAVTIMAIDYFHNQAVDIVLWETGMGGTYDATNAVNSVISIITNVALDHCRFLGDTVDKIARDKAGIIKPNSHFLTASNDRAVLEIFQEVCSRQNAVMQAISESCIHPAASSSIKQEFDFEGGCERWANISTNLTAPYQRKNIALAIHAALTFFSRHDSGKLYGSAQTFIRKGLMKVKLNGRFERICSDPPIIVDVAHNPAGIAELKETILTVFPNKKIALLIGVLRDKDYDSICRIIAPIANVIFCTEPVSERKLSALELAKTFRLYTKCPVHDSYSAEQTLDIFLNNRNNSSADVLLICGSFYLIGDVLKRRQLTLLKVHDVQSDYR